MLRVILSLGAACLLLISIASAQGIPFDQCGTLWFIDVEGGCWLFQADDGIGYEFYGSRGGYGNGDRVRVVGSYELSFSFCMIGACCLFPDTVMACTPPEPPSTNAIWLYDAEGTYNDLVQPGAQVDLHWWIHLDSNNTGGLVDYHNGFVVYSPDSATWESAAGYYHGSWPAFGERAVYSYTVNGITPDTVIFYGEDSAGGFLQYYDDVGWHTSFTVPEDESLIGKHICIDTISGIPPGDYISLWLWHTFADNYVPTWDGPHCFTIQGCCYIRGNVDNVIGPAGGPDVADLTFLVAYLFEGGSTPDCLTAADINGLSGPAGGIDIADVTYFVAFLFSGGPPPPPCP